MWGDNTNCSSGQEECEMSAAVQGEVLDLQAKVGEG